TPVMLHNHPHDLRPLAGLKIVSLAVNLPGPVAAARLRDLGASITKIEPPEGDPLARGCPPWFQALHKDVTIVPLDLKDVRQRDRLFALLSATDLLLTSSRPAALERLGLSWSELHPRFPRLCQVSIIGHVPPHDDQPGHDLTYQAALGLIDPPHVPRALLADLGGAEEAVSAAVALLLARERGQEAQAAYVSLAEAAARFGLPHEYGLTAPTGLLGGGWPGYNLYQAAEGWIAVAALEPHFAERLVRELGIESLTHELLAQAFHGRTADEWENWAVSHDLPIRAVRDLGR
ncbi:MAG TPA: CoA transferase, partial [Planctomycetaceae bacterium]|nr:CoA transferase [Planctomycetaceae bacterium]